MPIRAGCRCASITLRPLEAGLTAATTEADDTGNFVLRNVAPGQYSLIAERDRYLASRAPRRGALRMPVSFYIGDGEKIQDLVFRLRPWAVVSGKVKFDDGEPAPGVRVDLYREVHTRGRHGYAIVKSAATDDRGEYRVYGLDAGAYLVAADGRRSTPPGYQEQPRVDSEGRELLSTGYATTFYPQTGKLSGAVPVRAGYGQELDGIDIVFDLVTRVKIRGSVTSGISGQKLDNAAITLARVDSSALGTIPTQAFAKFGDRANFEIADVAPGSYLLEAQAGGEAGTTLVGSTILTVSSDDVNNVDLIAEPALGWSGEIMDSLC
ncbi:MAG TPA: carboxypeptidase-like regulatory domain-containing protein [Bryobacteraceae bacterium]|nr:carboxypeptidase-like regulatory domain-containing protein [Bryobacteraceae bacterium]